MSKINQFFHGFLITLIIAGTHILVYQYTKYQNERAAIKLGYGYYNQYLDFQYKTPEEIATEVFTKAMQDETLKQQQEQDKINRESNAQPLW